jgi:hypothetical protein
MTSLFRIFVKFFGYLGTSPVSSTPAEHALLVLLTPAMSVTTLVSFHSAVAMSVTELIRYKNYPILNLSDTEPIC